MVSWTRIRSRRARSGRFFEGAGDLLGFPDTWYGGYRQRSDIRVFPTLSDWFHREIIPLELIDNRFYHLDTCLCPLSDGELLYFPHAFDRYGQEVLVERVAPSRRLWCRKLRLSGLPAMPSVLGNTLCCPQVVQKQNPC